MKAHIRLFLEKNSKIDNDYPNWSYTYVLPSSYESSTYKPEYIQLKFIIKSSKILEERTRITWKLKKKKKALLPPLLDYSAHIRNYDSVYLCYLDRTNNYTLNVPLKCPSDLGVPISSHIFAVFLGTLSISPFEKVEIINLKLSKRDT